MAERHVDVAAPNSNMPAVLDLRHKRRCTAYMHDCSRGFLQTLVSNTAWQTLAAVALAVHPKAAPSGRIAFIDHAARAWLCSMLRQQEVSSVSSIHSAMHLFCACLGEMISDLGVAGMIRMSAVVEGRGSKHVVCCFVLLYAGTSCPQHRLVCWY